VVKCWKQLKAVQRESSGAAGAGMWTGNSLAVPKCAAPARELAELQHGKNSRHRESEDAFSPETPKAL